MKIGNRKIKKWGYALIILFIVLFIFCFRMCSNNNQNNNTTNIESNKNEVSYNDIIDDILSYDNSDFDKGLLNYVYDNYGIDSLKTLLNVLRDNKYDRSVWHSIIGDSYIVLKDKYNNSYDDNNQVTVIEGKKDTISISFAGDISLADNWEIMPYYKSRGKKIYGVLSEDIVDYMNNTNLMIINNEFCFSDRGTPMANKTYTFRGTPSNVSIYNEIGVDMVTLANNHVYDFGQYAFLDTLDTLNKADMPYIGAGRNIEEAKKAYYFVINGYKIAFLNASRAEKYILTPEATESTPGVFRAYDPNPLAERIKEEKENSDYVVALLHWGREDSHELEDVILKDAKLYVDSGADLVVGTHAHVLEGMEYYKDKLIAYNLGDFLFSHVSDYTGILTLNLSYDGDMSYKFIPAYQENFKTSLISGESADELYKLMTDWSINVKIDNNGSISEIK